MIDYVLSIDTLGQQFVVIKVMLQSSQLKYNVHAIGIDQSLSKNVIYEHKCLQNINKLYKCSGNWGDEKNLKILLRLIWFLILYYLPMTLLYLPWHQHQSRNQVIEIHCVFSLTYYMWNRKLVSVDLELLNQSARKLNMELYLGHWKKSENEIQRLMNR